MRQPHPTSTPKLATTALYYSSFILLGLMGALLGPTLPYLAENTASSLQDISIVFALRSAGYLIAALFVGRLFDRLAGHYLLLGMVLLAALSLMSIPLAGHLLLLALLMLSLGVASSTTDIGVNTLLVWLHREHVGPFMNGLHFAFGIGAFLAPIIVAQVHLKLGSPTWAYWLVASLAFPLVFFFSRLPSPQHQRKTELQIDSEQTHGGQINGLTLLVACFFFCYAGMEISYGNWLYTYAISLNIATEVGAAYMTSAYWGAFTLGRLLTIPLALRLKPIRLLSLCLLTSALFLGMMLLQPLTPWTLWLGSIGLGLAIAAIFPTMLSFAERRLDIQGSTMSTFFVGASLGGMSIPWFIGQVFERLHPAMMLIIVSCCWLLASCLLGFIWWHSRSKRATLRHA